MGDFSLAGIAMALAMAGHGSAGGQLAELTAWLDMVAHAGEFAGTFAQRGYTTPQAVARSGLTEGNLRAMGMSKMKTRKAVLHALKGVAASPMMPLPEPPPMMPELEPEMPVDAFFAAPAAGGTDAMSLAGSPWDPGWAPAQPSAAAGSSESWNVRQRPPCLPSHVALRCAQLMNRAAAYRLSHQG